MTINSFEFSSSVYSPLAQFEIFPLISLRMGALDFSITNSVLLMFMVVFFSITFFQLLTVIGGGSIVPSRWQMIGQGVYNFTWSLLEDNAGKRAMVFYPFVFSLFVFILMSNLLGFVPYSFTVTSHLVVTLTFALAVFIGKLIIGFRRHGIKLFAALLPPGVPMVLAPALILIEFISFNIVIVSLSVRLFANMMAGHILLHVIIGFAWTMLLAGGAMYFAHFAPLVVLFMVYFLELGVAIIQAYVFTFLTCMYLGDMLEGSH